MINVKYSSEGIRVDVGQISKYNQNLPLKLNIKKHVSKEIQWSTNLNDNWYATYPNTEMFDVEICDSKIELFTPRFGILWNMEIISINHFGCTIKVFYQVVNFQKVL